MSDELEITIAPDGTLKVEAKNHKGAGCLDELNVLLRDLEKDGIQTGIKDQKKKQEYYAAATKQTIQTKH